MLSNATQNLSLYLDHSLFLKKKSDLFSHKQWCLYSTLSQKVQKWSVLTTAKRSEHIFKSLHWADRFQHHTTGQPISPNYTSKLLVEHEPSRVQRSTDSVVSMVKNKVKMVGGKKPRIPCYSIIWYLVNRVLCWAIAKCLMVWITKTSNVLQRD